MKIIILFGEQNLRTDNNLCACATFYTRKVNFIKST